MTRDVTIANKSVMKKTVSMSLSGTEVGCSTCYQMQYGSEKNPT